MNQAAMYGVAGNNNNINHTVNNLIIKANNGKR